MAWQSETPSVDLPAIDRLIHHSVVIELNIPSFRLDAAKQKQKAKADSPSSKTRSDT
ncbi:MAG: hypothetical protein WKF77_07395 [Planctomycetaceae bacterium]